MKRRLAVLMSICLVSMFVFSGCARTNDTGTGNTGTKGDLADDIKDAEDDTIGDITGPVTNGTGTGTTGTGTTGTGTTGTGTGTTGTGATTNGTGTGATGTNGSGTGTGTMK